MRSTQEILDERAVLGRPEGFLTQASRVAVEKWDAENPEKRAQYGALSAELESASEAEAEIERNAEARRRADDALKGCGAGDRSLAIAASPNESKGIVEVRRWLAESDSAAPWALTLIGDVGTGKTVAACLAVRQEVMRGKTVAFRAAAGIARISDFDDGVDELKLLKRVRLLVLDDVGADNLTDRGRALLTELINARYEAGAHSRTIITANPQWPQLQQRLGQRICDRLREGRAIELAGASMRGAQKELLP